MIGIAVGILFLTAAWILMYLATAGVLNLQRFILGGRRQWR